MKTNMKTTIKPPPPRAPLRTLPPRFNPFSAFWRERLRRYALFLEILQTNKTGTQIAKEYGISTTRENQIRRELLAKHKQEITRFFNADGSPVEWKGARRSSAL